ncbi:MAG: hypothetical protein Q8P28_07635 [Deltaproteobacteria bacterium]|nr:hypothetical protein [Deltaproteobacteria bacterium]
MIESEIFSSGCKPEPTKAMDANAMKRWAIYIDIEGFSNIFTVDSTKAINLLGILMKFLYEIGNKVYPNHSERLFIHQFGDGFLIVSDFPEKSLGRPIAITVALMQILLCHDGVARAGISDGDYGDYKRCYQFFLGEGIGIEDGVIRPGFGIMTIMPTMGEALIKSYKIQNNKKSGPLLLIDPKLKDYLPTDNIVYCEKNNELIVEVNWIYSNPPIANKIFSQIGINAPLPANLVEKLKTYIERNKSTLTEDWKKNALILISAKSKVW